jgi:hypothetical protein
MELLALPPNRRVFLEGLTGTGKTTAAVARMMALLRAGVPGGEVVVLLPQRTLAPAYEKALRARGTPAGSEVSVLTLGGLGQRMISLFWPLIAEQAGFGQPKRPPVFLTMETAQYFMARIVRPLLEEGYFDAISIDRNRLYSQLLDNLNKAAVVGFDHTELGPRLKAAWVGDQVQLRVYDEAQAAAVQFREYCLGHNLLDFSLQFEVFARHLWPLAQCRDYLLGRYRHIIFDNAEEDTPACHDLLLDWLPLSESALIVYDTDAGYRRFLGADPHSAYRLRDACEDRLQFTAGFVQSEGMAALTGTLRHALRPRPVTTGPAVMGRPNALVLAEEMELFAVPAVVRAATPHEGPFTRPEALDWETQRYHPQMLDWVAGRIDELVHRDGVAPGRIAVLAPFVGGALRFSLENRLSALDVAVRSHRPSRALREEPVTSSLLTIAQLCHPEWGYQPPILDIAHMLMLSIGDLDLVRAQLLADIGYRVRDEWPALAPFAQFEEDVQKRITFLLGGRYEGLRTWIAANTAAGRGRPSTPLRSAQNTAISPGSARDAAASGGSTQGPTSRRSAWDSATPLRFDQDVASGGRAQRRQTAELDHFFSRLFGELLSQPGYGLHGSHDAGEITAKVIESARKFRQVMAASHAGAVPASAPRLLAREYIDLVQEGVVAAQYLRSWKRQPQDAVLIAPAHTFLMSNQWVDHQFWLDVGASAWWERLNQPLTHPYVLSRRWQGTIWTDLDEYMARQEALSDLALGLARRCRTQIHLALTDLGESGSEQRGTLLRAMQQVLRGQGDGRSE